MNPDTPKPAVPQIGEPADPVPQEQLVPADQEPEFRDSEDELRDEDERPEPGDLPI